MQANLKQNFASSEVARGENEQVGSRSIFSKKKGRDFVADAAFLNKSPQSLALF